jgi:hypothetical protein
MGIVFCRKTEWVPDAAAQIMQKKPWNPGLF